MLIGIDTCPCILLPRSRSLSLKDFPYQSFFSIFVLSILIGVMGINGAYVAIICRVCLPTPSLWETFREIVASILLIFFTFYIEICQEELSYGLLGLYFGCPKFGCLFMESFAFAKIG